VTTDPDTNAKAASTSSASRSPKAEAILGAAPDEQIAAAIAAEKWARATDLLEFHGERLLLDGGVRELSGWLEVLPDEYVTRHAKIAALFAWVRIYDQRYQDALTCLSKAERALQQLRLGESAAREASASDEVELRPFVELEHSLAAIRLHLQAVDGASGKLPQQVEDIMIPASGDHPLWRAGALVILGRSRLQSGDLRGAADDLEAAHTLASSSRGMRAARVTADAAVLLGRINEVRGKLEPALRLYEEVVQATAPRDGSPDATFGARLAAEVGLARVALQRLDLATAGKRLDVVRGALESASAAVDPIRVVFEGTVARATLHLVDGRSEEARASLDNLARMLGSLKVRWPLALIGAIRARHALLRKDEPAARRWLQQHTMRGDANQPPKSPIAAYEAVTEAFVQAALHQPKPALRAAQDALGCAESGGDKVLQIEAQLALALAHYGAGSREDARSALLAALAGAKAIGALLPLFVRGLDQVAAELGVASDELTRVQAMIPAAPPAQRAAADRPLSRPSNSAGISGPIQTSKVIAPVATSAAARAPAESAEAGAASADESEASPVEASASASPA